MSLAAGRASATNAGQEAVHRSAPVSDIDFASLLDRLPSNNM
jgi:hypothetical protein